VPVAMRARPRATRDSSLRLTSIPLTTPRGLANLHGGSGQNGAAARLVPGTVDAPRSWQWNCHEDRDGPS